MVIGEWWANVCHWLLMKTPRPIFRLVYWLNGVLARLGLVESWHLND